MTSRVMKSKSYQSTTEAKKSSSLALHRRQSVQDLQSNKKIDRLELVVLRKYPRRMLRTDSFNGAVAAGCGRDETGIVGIVFWGKQVDRVRVGDIIRIENGWCKKRDGELIVSSGKFGRLSVIS